jgi:deazaflavin-dependent oxidoreductase (nitroreductase family)
MSEAKPPNGPNKAVIKFASKLNVFVYRLTGGRVMGKMKGAPICLVTMTGRKSGRKITFPLMYNPDGGNVILVASLGGAPKNPVWYYNLMANPKVIIQLGAKKQEMLATQASPEQKAALWPSIVANYPDFEVYQKKTERDIPVIICSPVVLR